MHGPLYVHTAGNHLILVQTSVCLHAGTTYTLTSIRCKQSYTHVPQVCNTSYTDAKYFPDIFTVRSLYPDSHKVPREIYLPRREGTDFNELTCPFGCGVIFNTKAALQRHLVRMHKYKGTRRTRRTNSLNSYRCLTISRQFYAERTKTQRSLLLKQQRTVNCFEWRTLPLEHERVKAFVDNEPADQPILRTGSLW